MTVTVNLEYLLYVVFGLAMIYPLYCLYTMFKPKPLSEVSKKILSFLKDQENWCLINASNSPTIRYSYENDRLAIYKNNKSVYIVKNGPVGSLYYDITSLFSKREIRLIFKNADKVFDRLNKKELATKKAQAAKHVDSLLKTNV